jgi:hypothetical protein
MTTLNLTNDWQLVSSNDVKVQNISNARVVMTEDTTTPTSAVHGFILRPFEVLECKPIAGKSLYARKLDSDIARLEYLDRN